MDLEEDTIVDKVSKASGTAALFPESSSIHPTSAPHLNPSPLPFPLPPPPSHSPCVPSHSPCVGANFSYHKEKARPMPQSGPVVSWLRVHSISGWLSKNCDENSRMRKISYSKLLPKVRACVNSRRNFWTTNLKSSVVSVDACCNYACATLLCNG